MMRVVIVEDKRFFLDLLTDSLRGRGINVVGCADNPSDALRVIDDTAPDLAVLDICLSEAQDEVGVRDEEGLRVAELVRASYPDVGLLMLSAYFQPVYAERLLAMADTPHAVGYLSKERLGNLDELVDAFHRIVRGEVVIDPHIISQLMSRRRIEDPLERLTPHQRRILALVAEGRSNLGIAQHLGCKISAVEWNLSTITEKLDLSRATDHDRRHINTRVLATLMFLRSTGRSGAVKT
ncbi:MAG: response regulator [Pseudonocardiaceae bacterium]